MGNFSSRLIDIVQRHRKEAAINIRQAVIADVKQHIDNAAIFDHITLIVLKKT